MRIVYRARLSKPIVIPDFWAAPFLQGTFRPIEEAGKVVAFEMTFLGQPMTYAPKATRTPDRESKVSITLRDQLLPLVKFQLEEALAFIRCYFDIDVRIEEIEAEYSGESSEEDALIDLKSWKSWREYQPPRISFDYFTRAIMAAGLGSAPVFEATLVGASRASCLDKKYIDSFRYGFLLIEALYGDGKFKTPQLKDALKNSAKLRDAITLCLEGPFRPSGQNNSDTDRLLASHPTVDTVIDHLLEKRGFYFHGNVKAKRPWRPENQREAKGLALLTLDIAMAIAHDAAAPMFADEFNDRHFRDAAKAGAVMSLTPIRQ